MDEKRSFLDRVHTLEAEMKKNEKHHEASDCAVDELKSRLADAEKRANSSEMKLRAFLGNYSLLIQFGSLFLCILKKCTCVKISDERKSATVAETSSTHHDSMYQKMRAMQEELERKTKLLAEAKEALTQAKSLSSAQTTKQPKAVTIKN